MELTQFSPISANPPVSFSKNIESSNNALKKTKEPTLPLLGTNPLTSAAAKLFSILNQLKHHLNGYEASSLRSYLLNETQKFTYQAKTLGYQEENIFISEYILSHTIDEFILDTSWGRQYEWQSFSLTSTLPHAKAIEENFSLAMEKMLMMPDMFIDVLELIYLCLSLKKQTESTHLPWKNVQHLHNLYHAIQEQRGDFEKRLSEKLDPIPAAITVHSKTKFYSFFFMLVALLFMISMYFGFAYLNSKVSQPLEQQLNSLLKANINEPGRDLKS